MADVEVFEGTLRLAGRRNSNVTTTISVGDGRVRLAAGDLEIGDWPISAMQITRHIDQFHIAVEGEELVLVVRDAGRFAEAVEPPTKRGRRRIRNLDADTYQETAPPKPKRAKPKPAKSKPDRTREPEREGSFLDSLRELWERARELPRLTQIGLIVVPVVLLGWLAPGVLGGLLMLGGGAAVVVGQMALSDHMFAVKVSATLRPVAWLLLGVVGILLGFATGFLI
ncbi:MAG TPA: hypothetical protein VID03_09665 [Acidimicrobiia bacterium]